MNTFPAAADERRRQAEIAESARQCLSRSPYPALRGVACRCRRGVLILRGRLPDYYHKQLAQEAVRRVAGATAIVNQTEIVAPQSSYTGSAST